MIEVHSETLISMQEATRLIPGKPRLATLYRWFTKGIRGGIKLETPLVGGRRFTSREAVQRFVGRLSGERGDAVQRHRFDLFSYVLVFWLIHTSDILNIA